MKSYRPDIIFHESFTDGYKTWRVIVEVDEFKHRGSAYNCDVKRMSEIAAGLGEGVQFVRYNPDSIETTAELLLEKLEEVFVTPPTSDYNYTAHYMGYSKTALTGKKRKQPDA